MPKTIHHVFVAYARADAQSILPIIQSLRSEGLEIWIDEEGIEGATFWRKEIVDAISECSVVLFFASKRSCASDNVSKELALANEERKPILPVFIEEVEPSAELRYQIAGIQHVTWHANKEQSLRQVIAALRRYAPQSEQARLEAVALPIQSRRRFSRIRVTILAAIPFVALLSIIPIYKGMIFSRAPFRAAAIAGSSSAASVPQSPQVATEIDQLSSVWYIETVTKTSDYKPYLDMRLRFRVLLTQNGSTLDVRGEKIGEVTSGEARELSGRAKTSIHLAGHIENRATGLGRIVLSGDEDSTQRSGFSTIFELEITSGDLLIGSFNSTAANSSGSAVWISEKQWLSRGWKSQ
jgi:TIR domain